MVPHAAPGFSNFLVQNISSHIFLHFCCRQDTILSASSEKQTVAAHLTTSCYCTYNLENRRSRIIIFLKLRGTSLCRQTSVVDGPCTWNDILAILNHVALASLFFAGYRYLYSGRESNWDEYGNVAYVLFLFRILPLLSVPFCLFNFIGIYTFPLQLPQINCESSVKGEMSLKESCHVVIFSYNLQDMW